MKLKDAYITQDVDDVQFLIPTGAEGFRGIVRSNRTAAAIVNLLKKETTEEAVIDGMCARFDAPRDVIAADVREILGKLRRIGALEE